jgi:hypothetical protein
MTMWHLTFQHGKKPVSVSRADGVAEPPPAGVIRYVELEYGAWTLEPAETPVGMEGVEWPRECIFKDFLNCPGFMTYVEHVPKPVTMAQTGERVYPHGWVCDACGNQEVWGMAVADRTFPSRDYDHE